MKTITSNTVDGYNLTDHFCEASRLSEKLKRAPKKDIELDLSKVKWTTPAFIAPLSCAIRTTEEQGHNIRINPPNKSGVSKYLKVIGFPYGHQGGYNKDGNHMPLFTFGGEDDDIEEAISRFFTLLKRLSKNIPETQIDAIHYPLAELVDNVSQHAKCTQGSIMAQYYKRQDVFDICVADNGRTIPGNYEAHDISFQNDAHAIEQAIDGLSTKEGEQRGYGLRTTHDLVLKGLSGEFHISSRSLGLHKAENAVDSAIIDNVWDGTVISLRLNRPEKGFPYTRYLE